MSEDRPVYRAESERVMIGNELEGDGTWPWKAYVDGADIVVRGAKMTWFGVNDPNDNGMGAWGFHVAAHPEYLGVALPLSYGPCLGSPLPNLPRVHGIVPLPVKIWCPETKEIVYAHAVDEGPAKWTDNQLDGMPSVWKALKLPDYEKRGVVIVDYRIIGAAQYVGHAAHGME